MSDTHSGNMNNTTEAMMNSIEQSTAAALNGEIVDETDEQNMPVPLDSLNKVVAKKHERFPVVAPVNALPLEVMFDVPITLTFEIGRTEITIKNLMEMKEGSFIELYQVLVDVIDVRIEDVLIGSAETIALQQSYGIRMGELKKYSALENEEIQIERE